MLQFILNILFFIVIPLIFWNFLHKKIPLAVIPILVGALLSILGYRLGIGEIVAPSKILNLIGWSGVLLLAFTAGLESIPDMDQKQTKSLAVDAFANAGFFRILLTATAALTLPFVVGSCVAYWFLLDIPGWQPKQDNSLIAAAAIGLCLAVSALPVLVGIIREIPRQHSYLSRLALRIAVVDDVALWIGLACLLLVSRAQNSYGSWGGLELLAVGALMALSILSRLASKRCMQFPFVLAWIVAGLMLAIGAWGTSILGVHPFLGAYLAGILTPKIIAKKLHSKKLGWVALIFMASLFFGQRGLSIDGSIYSWSAFSIAFGLFIVSAITKVIAVVILPPVKVFSYRERIALGTLLQCKGLMEIVAATILQDQGILSTTAYAVLVTLAILSTIMTKPLFNWYTKKS